MANNPKRSATCANLAADAVGNALNSGLLRIYDGTQPVDAATAVSTQILLAELTLNADAFGAAASGVISANAITADSSANASGTASWFRCAQSDGTTVMFDGTVGTTGADLNLDSVSITAGGTVNVTSFTYTESLG